ncbi:ABC transporter ATP-binding protein [Oceanithermus sp.]
MLEINGVRKSFYGFVALDGVSLRVEPGRFHALVGPNGAGKTTLFNVIVGRYTPDAGEVRLEGRAITGWPTHRVVRSGLGISFQRAQAFLSMSVLENVTLAVLAQQGRTRSSLRPLAGYEEARARARELLGWVGLAERAEEAAEALPLGDLKRVDIAMALAGSPRLLLLDEPLAGLSRRERQGMVRFIEELLRGLGLTLLFTEHDTEAVLRLADRITVLHQGRVLAEGAPDEIKNDARVVEAFLGE